MIRQLILLFVIGVSQTAFAQQITVQQPVIQNFSVRTSVSVPDRGAASLGGVSSAASSRSASGPFRSGSSVGLSRESSSASAHVFIHDLRAMDEAILAGAKSHATSKIDPRIVRRLDARRQQSDRASAKRR